MSGDIKTEREKGVKEEGDGSKSEGDGKRQGKKERKSKQAGDR